MKRRVRLVLGFVLGTIGVLYGVLWYNTTVTFLDRPFFISNQDETIIATRVSWMCNCAEFVDTTKYKINPITEPDENDYFFIEASQPGQDWNRDYFINHKLIRLTGRFYRDKGLPSAYEPGPIEDKPSHARVFRFDKIEYLNEATLQNVVTEELKTPI